MRRSDGALARALPLLALAVFGVSVWCAAGVQGACPGYIDTPAYPPIVAGESVSGLLFTVNVLPSADVALHVFADNANITFTPQQLTWTSSSPLAQSLAVSVAPGSWSANTLVYYVVSGTNADPLAADYFVAPNNQSVAMLAARSFTVPPALAQLSGGLGPSPLQAVSVSARPAVDVVLTPFVPDLGGWITFQPTALTFTATSAMTLSFTATATAGVTGGSFAVVWRVTGTNAASFAVPRNSTQVIACAQGFNGTDCHDIDECASGTAVCEPFVSLCVNTPGSYICTPFVVPGTLFVANGTGTTGTGPTAGGVLLGDTKGGQILGMKVNVGVGDVVLSAASQFGWPPGSPSVPLGRQFVCSQIWTNLTGPVVPPPANVYGQPPFPVTHVNVTAYCVVSAAVGFGLQLSVGYATGAARQIVGFGLPSADTISYPKAVLLPHTLRLDATSANNPATDELIAVNTFGENIRFDGANFFPDPDLVLVYYGTAPTAHRPNPPLYRCTVDRVRTTATSLTCLTDTTGLATGVGLVFTVQASGYNTTGTDRYSYHSTPTIRAVTSSPSEGCTGAAAAVTFGSALVWTVTDCPTSGNVTLNVTGSGFLAPVSVFVNGLPCARPVLGAGAPFAAVDPESGVPLRYSLVSCTLPAGTGASQQMLVSSGELFSAPLPIVSYGAPVITGLSGCPGLNARQLYTHDCERHGATRITIAGRNFGWSGASVRIGVSDCRNVTHVAGQEHTLLWCITSGGTAQNQPVTVVQFNGLISLTAATLSYRQCPAGQFLVNDTRDCAPCPPGQFSPVAGQTACTDCAPGTANSALEAVSCAPCGRNTFQAAPGSRECASCPATQYQASVGQTACTQCGPAQYVADPTATNPCVACPVGATCDAFGVHANEGVFLISDKTPDSTNPGVGTLRALSCLPGMCVAATQCGLSNLTCCGANRLPPASNPLCGQCASGFTDVNGTCVACDKPDGGFLFLLLIASWLYVLVFHWLSGSKSSNETKIFLYFVQGVLLFFGGRTGLLSWASFVDFNVFSVNNSSSPVCIAPLTGLQQLMMGFVVPLISLVQLWITYVIREALWLCIGRREKMRRTNILTNALELTAVNNKQQSSAQSPSAVTTGLVGSPKESSTRAVSASVHNRATLAVHATQHKGCVESVFDAQDYNAYIRTSVALFLFSYNALVNTIFEFLSCTTVTPGVSVITSQPSVSCESSEYAQVRVFMLVMLVLVVCLAPVVIVVVLYVAYLLNRTIDPVFQTRYGLLFEGYRSTCFWFESYVLMRRVTLIALLVSLRNETTLFSFVSLANILFLFFHGIVRAYVLQPHNNLETYTLWVHCILTVMLATAHNPLTYYEALGFSCLIFGTAGVFVVWLIYAKSRELLADTALKAAKEKRRKRLVEMSYEQVALEAVAEDDILLVRLQDGTLARVYAPGLGIKAAAQHETKAQGLHNRAGTHAAAAEYKKTMQSMMHAAASSALTEDAAITIEGAPPAPQPDHKAAETAPPPVMAAAAPLPPAAYEHEVSTTREPSVTGAGGLDTTATGSDVSPASPRGQNQNCGGCALQ